MDTKTKLNDNDFVAIRKSKVTLNFYKPAYVRICILHLSKVLMYEFYYDYMKNKYGKKSKLLLTDTNSLIYEIKTEYVHEDFSKDKEMFDFSNYAAKPKYYDDSNKLVAGKMKEETGAVTIEELVGLKPRMYSFLVDDSSELKKAKSVNKNIRMYKECSINTKNVQ